MSGGRDAGESWVWRDVIAGVRMGEMSHPQNKFRILSVATTKSYLTRAQQ